MNIKSLNLKLLIMGSILLLTHSSDVNYTYSNDIDNEELTMISYNVEQESKEIKPLLQLEIPKIKLWRNVYTLNSSLNQIKYNVTILPESYVSSDGITSHLFLAAHSGNASISYFRKLINLNLEDEAYIKYDGQKYHYQVIDIKHIPKENIVQIKVAQNKHLLTLFTCIGKEERLIITLEMKCIKNEDVT